MRQEMQMKPLTSRLLVWTLAALAVALIAYLLRGRTVTLGMILATSFAVIVVYLGQRRVRRQRSIKLKLIDTQAKPDVHFRP